MISRGKIVEMDKFRVSGTTYIKVDIVHVQDMNIEISEKEEASENYTVDHKVSRSME